MRDRAYSRQCHQATIISCYLPQTVEAHSLTCATLAQQPHNLPHSLIIFGTSRGDGDNRPRKMHTLLASLTKGGRGPHTPPSLHANNLDRSHALIISPYGIMAHIPPNSRHRHSPHSLPKPPRSHGYPTPPHHDHGGDTPSNSETP